MASNNPFYGISSSPNTVIPANGSTQRLGLDNLIRRELKVADPSDPLQIAQALISRYQSDPRAVAISQEAKGLPFLLSAQAPAAVPQAATSSDAELQQAINDVERDLQELTTNAVLKDTKSELQGWAAAVRSLISEGSTAARFALDPRQRDKVFGIRRTLGDYARMARLVGALTPVVNINYRKFAQSLDEVAAVLMVMMGEAIANVGFNGGRYLLQAPYSELQVRRDAAIYALRNLIGATQEAYGPNDWPRGVDAYRRLFNILEQQGQGDLRALLVENELMRVMDMLLQRAGQGGAEGLRQLGATAQLDVERLRRLVIVGQNTVSPESPPLTAFLEALQLFVDAFDTSGGFRLLQIARPTILFYGLYGTSGFEDTDRNLIQLVIYRGQLADRLDCFMQCGGNTDAVKKQITLDKILYDVDRAIDLYAVGTKKFGFPERRAAAYSFFIDAAETKYPNLQSTGNVQNAGCNLPLEILDHIKSSLRPSLSYADSDVKSVVDDLISYASEVYRLESNFNGNADKNILTNMGKIADALQINSDHRIIGTPKNPQTVDDLASLFAAAQQGYAQVKPNYSPKDRLELPITVSSFFGVLQQELCIQKDMEKRWADLVKTMAPDCVPYADVLDATINIIDQAVQTVSGQSSCPSFDIAIPPHFETSFDGLVNDISKTGNGRQVA